MSNTDSNALRAKRPADPKHAKNLNLPFAAVPHRVIDSQAFADLPPSAVQVLLILVRQLTRTNNGRLQATRTYLRARGVGSEHTIKRALTSLIEHGFIFRTKAGAFGRGAAQYAVTWLSLTGARNGLTHIEWFKYGAWQTWNKGAPLAARGAENPRGHGKKNPPEMQGTRGRIGPDPDSPSAVSAAGEGARNAHDEYSPIDAQGKAAGRTHRDRGSPQHRPRRRPRGSLAIEGKRK